MLEQLQKIYNEVTGRDDLVLNPRQKLSNLQLSSLGLIQLICQIEDTFDVEISNQELLSFKTVKHVIICLEKKLN